MDKRTLTLGSLFDGSGGFPLAGILSGIQPVWASEVDPFAVRVTTKRLPGMVHYGDVSALSGAELPPVDIITFGSPCQDMSIAGRRTGLDGERSGLFHEAIRIIKEMREETDGERPRYCVWENVPGAFSSNGGEDFRAVLEAVIGIREPEAEVPAPDKNGWPYADVYLGDGWSVAYRLLDAQYWGVPQRRARIFLVADLGGERAGDILFKSEGMSGYSAEGFRAWKETARDPRKGLGASVGICLNDQGGERMDVSDEVTGTLRAQDHGHPPLVVAAGFCTEHSAKSRSIGYEEEVSPTLRAGVVPGTIALEHHPTDCRVRIGSGDVVQTLTGRMGTGGNNVPLLMTPEGPFIPYTLKIRCGKEGGGKGALVQEDRSATLATNNDQTLFAPSVPVFHGTKNSHLTRFSDEAALDTLVATDYKDPPVVSAEPYYIVRRLTPTECARLQGFPDWWCKDLETVAPTEEEIAFWTEVFETHRKVVTHAKKPKTRNQIVKWLRSPHLDSAEYRLWGNGVALPCVWFVFAGIVYYDQFRE